MADRVFKGKLITTGDIHEENLRAFPEASEDFRSPHSGGLEPFQMLYDILMGVSEEWRDLDPRELEDRHRRVAPIKEQPSVKEVNGSLWISHEDMWVKIDADGTFEIGIAGA